MSELNEFFEQILHTERSLSSRNIKLRKLKEEIQSCALALKQVCEEVETRQGELAVRNVKMVDQEVEARLLELRKTILEEQSSKLSVANQIMTSELEKSKQQLESDSEQFLEELKEFGRSYDLVGSGYKHREQQTQKKVCTLQDEVLLLEAELTEFESEREEVKKLEQKLAEVEQTLQQKHEDKKVLENQMLDIEAEIKQLKEESVLSSSRTLADPEIVKLQSELEECKDCPEERTYHSLHRELEELQRLCYHKQMKQHLSRRQKRDHQSVSGRVGGVGSASKSLSFDASLLKGHYNPYTHQYVPSMHVDGEVEHNDGAVEESEGREDENEGQAGSSMMVGDEEEGEGWDDELEAAELAMFQESLSVSEMEWVEDEAEEGRGGKGGEVTEGEGEGEHQEKRARQQQTLSQGTSAKIASSNKYSFIKPSSCHTVHLKPQLKHSRTVVKRGGERPLTSAHLACVTDSPMPGTTPPKKSSGQSIYKAPGLHDPMQGVPKTAKRVRFRY